VGEGAAAPVELRKVARHPLFVAEHRLEVIPCGGRYPAMGGQETGSRTSRHASRMDKATSRIANERSGQTGYEKRRLVAAGPPEAVDEAVPLDAAPPPPPKQPAAITGSTTSQSRRFMPIRRLGSLEGSRRSEVQLRRARRHIPEFLEHRLPRG
jgi:hypothetical protein